MKDLLRLEDIHKVYRMGEVDVKALDGVDLSVKKGEFVSIIGPSGSGKSTLMNMMGLLDTPTKGKILLEEKNTGQMSENTLSKLRGKKIGFVFQTFNLVPFLNASENVYLPMIFQNKPKEELLRTSKELLVKVGLKERLFHKPSELSGGERQRIAIARALSNNPEIIFADEPTGNLDSKTGKEIMNLLEKLNKEENKTLIIVTHDLNIAERADRKVVMQDGKILKEVKK